MPSFSSKSKSFLDTCSIELQRLFNEVIKTEDCTILCGHRGKEEQEIAFLMDQSKAHWGQSPHNLVPSCAVDVMPCPIDWKDKDRVTKFYEFVKSKADEMGIKIRWGADWDMDGNYWERSNWEIDGPHYELIDTSHSKLPEG